MRDERIGDPMCLEGGNDCRDVAVGAGVVIAEESNDEGNTQVIMQDAREEGIRLVPADRVLPSPVGVVPSKPEEVVAMKVYAGAEEVQEQGVAHM